MENWQKKYQRHRAKIFEFNQIDFEKASDLEIEKKLMEILTVDNFTFFNLGYFPKTSKFYRVRKVDVQNITCEDDFWEAPSWATSINRFNRDNESTLYVSANYFEPAVLESRMKSKEKFVLIKYRLRDNIHISQVGIKEEKTLYEDQFRNKLREANINFINKWVTKEGTRMVYRVSNIIKKLCIELMQDKTYSNAILYNSVLDDQFYNVALEPSYARRMLEIEKIYYCMNTLNYSGIGSPLIVIGEIISAGDNFQFMSTKNDLMFSTTTEIKLDREEIMTEVKNVYKEIGMEVITKEKVLFSKMNRTIKKCIK